MLSLPEGPTRSMLALYAGVGSSAASALGTVSAFALRRLLRSGASLRSGNDSSGSVGKRRNAGDNVPSLASLWCGMMTSAGNLQKHQA